MRTSRQRYQSKIVDAAALRPGLGSFGDLGPGALASGEWQALGLELPDLSALRADRLARLRAALVKRDLRRHRRRRPAQPPLRHRHRRHAALVPCTTPVRYAFVATQGPVILLGLPRLRATSPRRSTWSTRSGTARAWYLLSGGRARGPSEHAGRWAAEIAELVRSPRRRQPERIADRQGRSGPARCRAREPSGLPP